MGTYKQRTRQSRGATIEDLPVLGMQYTNNNIAPGFCKALVNFVNNESLSELRPRAGYKAIAESQIDLPQANAPVQVHHTSKAMHTQESAVEGINSYSLLYAEQNNGLYNMEGLRLLVESGTIKNVPNIIQTNIDTGAESFTGIFGQTVSNEGSLHGVSYPRNTLRPIYANMNNITYLPAKLNNGDSCLCELRLHRDTALSPICGKLDKIIPRNVTPTEAVNYGYNMLKESPYSFEDVKNTNLPAGYILLDGLLPYKDTTCQEVKFNARVGEKVCFRLFVQAPDTTSTYKFRWELRDVYSDAITVYSDEESDEAKTYNYSDAESCMVDEDGNEYIYIELAPPYKQFSVTVTAYDATEINTETEPAPIQVLTLASYTLSSDASEIQKNVDMADYDLTTAQGMVNWNGYLVLYGLPQAEHMLFVSAAQDPTYFPYPHNVSVYNEPILKCVEYLDELIVFTTSKVFKLTWSPDMLFFTKTLIQTDLRLTSEDLDTVLVIKNLVFFKNQQYYYMIVPNKSSVNGNTLQLAPISSNITNLLDNWETDVPELINTMYNIQEQFNEPIVDLIDYYNYIDGDVIVNSYKYALKELQSDNNYKVVNYIDFMLCYNTLKRAWYTQLVENNVARFVPYKQSITGSATLFNIINSPVNNKYNCSIELATKDVNNPKDELTLVLPAQFPMRQYLDTGVVAQDVQNKKRYREMQFRFLNKGNGSLLFSTEFSIDDRVYRDMYKYTTTVQEQDGYKQLLVARTYNETLEANGTSILAPENTTMRDAWLLGKSYLETKTISKVRLIVSGKGYSPRLKLLSFNDTMYSILSYNWVYRTMNMR